MFQVKINPRALEVEADDFVLRFDSRPDGRKNLSPKDYVL